MTVGWGIAIYELSIYFFCSYKIRQYYQKLQNIDVVMYYWLTMTFLTFIWECSYIYNFDKINIFSQDLIKTETHVWTNDYDLTYVLPWKLAFIFYAEYGAYADREYMINTDDWSRVVESSHAIFCGIIASIVLYQKIKNSSNKFYIAVGVSMGSQLMNSILYMANYFIQLDSESNINYCSDDFPCGGALLSRAFMYVNVFWIIMPTYAIIITWKNSQQPIIYSSNTEKSKDADSVIPLYYKKDESLH